jgi:exodeoxyribonuclease V alpha subunit
VETKTKVKPSLEQQHAIDLCCDMTQSIVGITGGAGTGKTLVLGEVYDELKALRKRIQLIAPTGRAAKRIEELTGIKAKTIHRFLEFPMPDEQLDPETDFNEPKKGRDNPVTEQVVLVDESSMIGPTLYRQLMDALPKGGVIRFFGDNNQLPPVEDGLPPFYEVLKRYPSVELSFNFRSEDLIVSNAGRILRGMLPQQNDRFVIIYSMNPIKEMLEFVTKDFMEDTHQIIMPTRRGSFGTMRVNPSLQVRFNRKGKLLLLDRYDEKEAPLGVRSGDKFLWIKNDYKLSLWNGEIGNVSWLDNEEGSLGLHLPDRDVTVPARVQTYSPWHGHIIGYDPRKSIELGYAVTTHKAQGSEFETIIYCCTQGQAYLLNRRNFYTAVTRAKHLVVLIMDRRAMGLSMRPHDVYR